MASLPASGPASASTGTVSIRNALIVTGIAGIAAAVIIFMLAGSAVAAAGFLAASIVSGGAIAAWRSFGSDTAVQTAVVDLDVIHAVTQASDDAIAVTDRIGRLVCANDHYATLFPGYPTPPDLPLNENDLHRVVEAGRAAWRDGSADVDQLNAADFKLSLMVSRAGIEGDTLIWRLKVAAAHDMAEQVEHLIAGPLGERLGAGGIMVTLLSQDGRVRSANRVLRARSTGFADASIVEHDFAKLLSTDSRGLVRFVREGAEAAPLRIVQIPFLDGESAPMLVALLDEEELRPSLGTDGSAPISSLVGLMPFGMALVDRDGRFIQMNSAFKRAAGVDNDAMPLYPGDLVVREDKTAVADAIRRFAGGATHSADMAVRLKGHPEEPVALTIGGARGLGDAAVLLSLKDNGEESRLKREVAQATKMQAVGQLAGGVAHDFNNILTAIIGHCDLMMMRHSPGDSDYDDIQQIRTNSNRAAGLTRQLLAFSRQQTLRPQILLLPDVVSEVSNLLKRLMGETVTLEVTHGRDQGQVRADPGQLEQVVVNLAVNARDAMLSHNARGGGKLSIHTRAISAAQVQRMGLDVLPVADYTVLVISDTGTGIAPEVLPKIFEPFFTTKEVGRGTGLGLSTVYGIVKQSGGYIFADSKPGQGAIFSIYLPVHASTSAIRTTTTRLPSKPEALWGTGTILLVEDEDMVRAVAERALVRQGYSVLTAENGEAALEVLDGSGRPDLLISDVVMPTMDGPTLVRRVRDRYSDLPIIFMSGYAEEQLRRSIDLDNVSFLPKPFSVQQLAEAARDALIGQ